MTFDSKEFFDNDYKNKPCVYWLYFPEDKGRKIYIGSTTDLKSRLKDHACLGVAQNSHDIRVYYAPCEDIETAHIWEKIIITYTINSPNGYRLINKVLYWTFDIYRDTNLTINEIKTTIRECRRRVIVSHNRKVYG